MDSVAVKSTQANTQSLTSTMFGACRVVPVLSLDNPDHAEPVLRALEQAGVTVIEVTLRTPGSLKAIERMCALDTDIVVGAGTVISRQQFSEVIAAGAKFAISPSVSEPLVMAARESGIPYLPGVMTPSEVQQAHELGFTECKLFPAATMGGPQWLRHLGPIYPSIRFCVTGGVDNGNVRSYLELDNVFAAGGGYVAPRHLIQAEQWSELTRAVTQSIAASRPE